MAIKLPGGINVTVKEPIDTRLILTKDEMKNIKFSVMPDLYFCICKENKKLYIFDKNIPYDEKGTGCFREYIAEIDPTDLELKLPAAIKAAMESQSEEMSEAIAKTLPNALADAMTDPIAAKAIADALFDSEHFDVTIDNKIDLALDTIQAIGPAV